jgi:protein-S-isoprenylcysteine O-methyltransferase Ste14
MGVIGILDLAAKLMVFVWFGCAKSHFAKHDKEPAGMTGVKITYLVGLAINLWMFWVNPSVETYLRGVGLSMTIMSAAIFFLAIRATKTARLHVAFSESTGTSLVSDGIYRIVRHPFYLAYLVYWSSWCFSVGFAGLSLLIMFVLIAFYIFTIRLEERALERNFGSDYRAYKKQTSLLLPKIL